jgi:tRNA dimethylallyltransferase
MGPTASGKTGLAVELAQRLPVELISVDSALVYCGMDIGTAKPEKDTLARAPHHLINIIPPTEVYSAAQFRADALGLMAEITMRGRVPLLVGGTMLYFKALQSGLSRLPPANATIRARLEGEAGELSWPAMHARLAKVDPKTAARLEPADAQRIQRALEVYELTGTPMSRLFNESDKEQLPYHLLKISLLPSNRAILHQRIAERFNTMLALGLIDELKQLRKAYPSLDPFMPSMRCVGYRQAWQYLQGDFDLIALREKGIASTRQLAKRQMTWLRSMDDSEVLDCHTPNILDSLIQKVGRHCGLSN